MDGKVFFAPCHNFLFILVVFYGQDGFFGLFLFYLEEKEGPRVHRFGDESYPCAESFGGFMGWNGVLFKLAADDDDDENMR